MCQTSFHLFKKKYLREGLDVADIPCIMIVSQGEMEMNTFEDQDAMNAFLAQLAADNAVEPMVEPIDEPECSPFDYAEVTGLWDEMYPETEKMVDENGQVWYIQGI